jgi:cytochrome P450
MVFPTFSTLIWWLAPIITLPVLAIAIHDYLLRKRLPPGPPPNFLTGNRHQIPAQYPWIKFQEWSKVYGGVFTIWLGRRPTIIISDPHIAVELMEKRSQKYSSRPRFVVMGEVHWENASILVQPYGKEWSTRRKLLHSALTPRALTQYQTIQEAEACRMCYQLLSRPDDWEGLLDWMTASIVFSIAYGHRVDSINSPVVRERLAIMHYASSLNVPGKYLAESFPVLRHMPLWLSPWKRDVKRNAAVESSTNMRLMKLIENGLADEEKAEKLAPSLCKSLLERRQSKPEEFQLLSDRDLSFIPASLFGAGADTTASTLCSAFLALVTHPETLRAAQSEMDAVVGDGRMPTFADEADLPYLRALCKEVLRWRPVAVLGGTPHATSEQDTYNGWNVPKGTNILGNTWAINHDERYYPNSQHFNPLRFLDCCALNSDDVSKKLPYLDRSYISSHLPSVAKPEKQHPGKWGHSSFGWGRRICPGAELAMGNEFIALARLLWGFDIRPKEGVKYDVWDYVGGFNVRPRHFECEIKIRSAKHEETLKNEYEGTALDVVRKYPLFPE